MLPILKGNTDTGVGFGLLADLAKYHPEYTPYRWWQQAQFMMSLKKGPDGYELPIHNHYWELNLPGLAGGRLRLYIMAAYIKSIIASYYGLGNQSPDDLMGVKRRNQFIIQFPEARIRARVTLIEFLSLFINLSFKYTFVETYAGSKLEEDLQASAEGTGETLYGAGVALEAGYDGWEVDSDPAIGCFLKVENIDTNLDLDPVEDPCGCDIEGWIMLSAVTDGTNFAHPKKQHELISSNTCDVSGYKDWT